MRSTLHFVIKDYGQLLVFKLTLGNNDGELIHGLRLNLIGKLFGDHKILVDRAF
ncbi:MAG: transposase [cyanobacterium endosymbiont of Rhopalodia sterrenbergii]